MEEKRKDDENPIVIYTSQDGQVHINVRIVDETAWLTQAAMAQLFGCGSDNIVKHLKNIYDEGELKESATTEIFSVVRFEGDRQVTRQIKHYNLDAIIAVGADMSAVDGNVISLNARVAAVNIEAAGALALAVDVNIIRLGIDGRGACGLIGRADSH